MRALVTGGAGFIGSTLVDRLRAHGVEPVALDLPGRSRENLPSDVRLIEGDVRDPAAMRRAAEGVDLVFHLAARTDLAGRSVAEYDTNVAGTRAVAEAARAAGARRLLFVSSMLAVGPTGTLAPIDEASTRETPSAYGKSKREGEALVRASGVPYTILRPTLVYGPRERATMYAMFRAIRERKFLLIGGDYTQSFVHAWNVADAAIAAALHPGAAGGTYFVSDERPYTLAEFAGTVADALGVRLWPVRLPLAAARAAGWAFDRAAALAGHELILSSRRVATMTTHYVYSVDAARRGFGFVPGVGLREGVRETAAWYVAHGLLAPVAR